MGLDASPYGKLRIADAARQCYQSHNLDLRSGKYWHAHTDLDRG